MKPRVILLMLQGMLTVAAIAMASGFIAFVCVYHRFPVGNGEVWNWMLGLR